MLPIKSKTNTDFGSNIEKPISGYNTTIKPSYNSHLISGNNCIKGKY